MLKQIAFLSLIFLYSVLTQAEESYAFTKMDVKKYQAGHEQLIKAASGCLMNDKKDLNERCYAAELLGNLRAIEAIPMLLENIDTISEDRTETVNNNENFPCWIALSKIGAEIIRPSFKAIASGKCSEMKVYLILKALERVEGNKAVLEAMLAEFPEGKERLIITKSISDYLKNWGKNWSDELPQQSKIGAPPAPLPKKIEPPKKEFGARGLAFV